MSPKTPVSISRLYPGIRGPCPSWGAVRGSGVGVRSQRCQGGSWRLSPAMTGNWIGAALGAVSRKARWNCDALLRSTAATYGMIGRLGRAGDGSPLGRTTKPGNRWKIDGRESVPLRRVTTRSSPSLAPDPRVCAWKVGGFPPWSPDVSPTLARQLLPCKNVLCPPSPGRSPPDAQAGHSYDRSRQAFR
jgi:hypothetical protein